MDLSTDLAFHLRQLVDRVGDGNDDALADSLTALAADLRDAVSSYLGLRLTLVLDEWPVTLTAFGAIDGARPTTSLRLVLSSVGQGFDPDSRIVLYAETRGALVDLAADLAHLQRIGDRWDTPYFADQEGYDRRPAVTLDADLPPVSAISGFSGMREYATINQAVGVLIERGHRPDEAHAFLRRAAGTDGLALLDYAARLIQE